MQNHKLPKLTDLENVAGTYVLVRASLNVPVADGVVTNQFRIMRAMPTINWLRTRGARVIVCAHIGRETTETLRPVFDVLQTLAPTTFAERSSGSEVMEVRNTMQDGDVLLLENLRQDPREKANDPNLVADLASLAEVFVNDAFAASHRAHASLVGVPQHLPTYFGLNFMHEYDELLKAMQPHHPALFLLGGAKFDTKMPLVEKYLDEYDHVFIGGALANDFFKAKGLEVGKSLVSEIDLSDSPLLTHTKILLPTDVVVEGPDGCRTCAPEEVATDEAILDAGPDTIEMLREYVAEAKTILWNGPLGNFEAGYGAQTEALGRLIAGSSAYSVLGGGDTIAAIESLGCQEKFGFLSTAGGAMLTFLEHKTLPAIEAVVG